MLKPTDTSAVSGHDCAAVVRAIAAISAPFGMQAAGSWSSWLSSLAELAARIAGIDTLVYHSLDTSGLGDVEEARRLLQSVLRADEVRSAIEAIVELRISWGTADGT